MAKILFPSLLFCLSQLSAPVNAQDTNISQLRSWLQGMQTEAVRLEDTLALGRLQRVYGYYIDKGYWQEAADLFATRTFQICMSK